MAKSLGKRAVVIGAGIGGLTAAKALSPHFDGVTVLERDSLPSRPEARGGTPQSRHVHALLKGGCEALESFFPGFEIELEAAGAVRVRAGTELRLEMRGFDPFTRRDLALDVFFMSRPLLEFVVRRFVERQLDIELKSKSRVIELTTSSDGSSVTGVRFQNAEGENQTLDADLVVDASSRGTPTLELLERIGVHKPNLTEIGVDLGYATAVFETPSTAPQEWRAIIHRPDPSSPRGAFLFPIEHNQWHVNLNGVHGDQPPDDLQGFLEFAKSLRAPTVYEAIKDATLIGPIYRYGLPCSVRRHFEALKSFPHGIIPIGDFICRFNPAFGQGMSVAAQESSALDRLLESRAARGSSLGGLAEEFFATIQDTLRSPWLVAESDFMFEKTRGERPPDLQNRQKFSLALMRLAAEDADVHRLITEVNHLMKPTSILRAPEIVSRVTSLMATDG